MKFNVLPDILHPTAIKTWEFFRHNRGVARPHCERPLSRIDYYVPTIWGTMPTGRILVIEVTDVALPPGFKEFIYQCQAEKVPAQIYVAMPDNAHVECRDANRRLADQFKLGFATIDSFKNCNVEREALALSLSGARSIPLPTYPARFREPLAEAQSTYLNGNANKGVSQIWDQVELVTRKAAAETEARGWWKTASTLDFATGNWYPLMEQFHQELDFKQSKIVCPEMKLQLIAKVMGCSVDRNLSAHEPKTYDARVRRDQRLRTLFESAFDLLTDFIDAAKPLRIKF